MDQENKEKQIDSVHDSLQNVIDAYTGLAKSAVKTIHSAVKDSLKDENEHTILSCVSSTLNKSADIVKSIKISFDKTEEKAQT